MPRWIGPDPGPGERVAEGDINSWLAHNPGQIAAVAKGTGIDRARLEAAAKAQAQLSAEELGQLREWLKEYSPG